MTEHLTANHHHRISLYGGLRQNRCWAAAFWPQMEYNMIDFSATQEQNE